MNGFGQWEEAGVSRENPPTAERELVKSTYKAPPAGFEPGAFVL